MSDQDQFFGQTRHVPRPTGSERTYRHQTAVTRAHDQVQWDVAEAYRWESRIGASAPTTAEIRRADLETRARLAFLATAGGTTQEWEHAREQIVADYLRQEDALARRRRFAGALVTEQSAW